MGMKKPWGGLYDGGKRHQQQQEKEAQWTSRYTLRQCIHDDRPPGFIGWGPICQHQQRRGPCQMCRMKWMWVAMAEGAGRGEKKETNDRTGSQAYD